MADRLALPRFGLLAAVAMAVLVVTSEPFVTSLGGRAAETIAWARISILSLNAERPDRPPDKRPFPEIRDWSSLRIGLQVGCDPSTQVTIYGDGTVAYLGDGGAIRGRHTGHLSADRVRDLATQFRSAEFFQTWNNDEILTVRPISAFLGGGCASERLWIAFDGKGKSVDEWVPWPAAVNDLSITVYDLAMRPWFEADDWAIDSLKAEGYFDGPQDGPALLARTIDAAPYVATVRRIIKLGAVIRDGDGSLVAAAQALDPEILKLVLSARRTPYPQADLDAALVATLDTCGSNCAEQFTLTKARRLLAAGADPKACIDGESPLKAARDAPPSLVRLLRSHGAKATDSCGN